MLPLLLYNDRALRCVGVSDLRFSSRGAGVVPLQRRVCRCVTNSSLVFVLVALVLGVLGVLVTDVLHRYHVGNADRDVIDVGVRVRLVGVLLEVMGSVLNVFSRR